MKHKLIADGIELLEFLFVFGLGGSVILIILTSIEDFREVLFVGSSDESEPEPLPR